MTKKIAHYGSWDSPIGIDSVVSEQRIISSPRASTQTGRNFFVESRKSGGNTIMEIIESGTRDILPAEFSVENRVYEYGASLYDILPDGRIIFSNKDDTVRILDADTQKVSLLVAKEGFRYSSFNANINSPWVLAIEEDHTFDNPLEVTHHIVAIDFMTTEVKKVVTGADFYYLPAFSIDGAQLTWLEWDHPGLPFNAAKIFIAEWHANGSIINPLLLSGDKSITEPRWGYDGTLFFAQETRGYRQLFRVAPGSNTPNLLDLKGLEEAEFGEVDLIEGSRTYTPLSEKKLFAAVAVKGVHKLIVIDLETESWHETSQSQLICQVNLDSVTRLTESSILVVGKSIISSAALYRIDVQHPECSEIIRMGSDADQAFDSFYSTPEPLYISSKGLPIRKIYGFLWMPYNNNFVAPEGDLPPLIIDAHGGPTWSSGCGLLLKTQYFTSRGYAYVLLNYTGSTGYGREYREGLFGNWGIIEASDAAECAQYLASTSRVNPDAIGISGHSAGGYTTLQCLTRHPRVFAGGICAAGISDLETFDTSTHKLEYNYSTALILSSDSDTSDNDVKNKNKIKTYRERSAVCYVDRIQSPLLLLHAENDNIVPIKQARIMAEALSKRQVDVKIVEFKDEGHMMDKPSTMRTWLEEEELWWRKTLL